MSIQPNVLIISHNCFSKRGSNGRTLSNFFINWTKESIAQFYISNEIPDFEVCDNYFRVTDIEAFKAFYKGTKVGQKINKQAITDNKQDVTLNNIYKKHRKKTSLNYIIRNLIWDSNRWINEKFKRWVEDFNPDIIVLQLGDYAFMLRIALNLAKRRKIPLIIYNSEDYFFKDRKSLSPLFNYYRYDYKRQVKKLLSYASHSIYNSEMLQQTYQNKFKHKSTVIMTSTDIVHTENKSINSPLRISYLGNLGVGRYEPLIEIAETLHKISDDLYLDIYGKVPDQTIEKALKLCNGIRLKGFVSYEEVVNIMKSSDLLIHAENFNKFYQWDLKHAFSTKIADSLASGTCFFVYAPKNLACVKYLTQTKTAFIVTAKQNLKESLNKIIVDNELRQKYIDNSLKIVISNHNAKINQNKFKKIIYSIVKR